MTSTKPRYDFYQTETAVNVSVFVRGLSASDADVVFGQHSLSMKLRPSNAAPQSLDIQLFDEIDATNSSYTVLNSKVDVLLQKRNPGRRWAALESAAGGDVPSYEDASTSTSTSAAASHPTPAPTTTARARSKWDNLKLDDDDESEQPSSSSTAPGSKPTGQGASIDAFFQKIYADADDDTRRAMMKSYQESGGTSLSTNWSEVGKGKVEPQPPGGMEARKW